MVEISCERVGLQFTVLLLASRRMGKHPGLPTLMWAAKSARLMKDTATEEEFCKHSKLCQQSQGLAALHLHHL